MNFNFIKTNIKTKSILGVTIGLCFISLAYHEDPKIFLHISFLGIGLTLFNYLLWVFPFSLLALYLNKINKDLLPKWLLSLAKLSLNTGFILIVSSATAIASGIFLFILSK